MIGQRGKGKTEVALRLFNSPAVLAAPRTVVDPAGAAQTDLVGAVTFGDPYNVPGALLTRFVPDDPRDLEAYDALFQGLYDTGGPRLVLADDVKFIAPSDNVPKGFSQYVFAGRKRMLAMIATMPQAVGACPELRSEADMLVVFPLGRAQDRRTVAADGGVELADLEAALKRVGPPLEEGGTATGFVILRHGVIHEVPTW